jgi:CheY-like chemotaxis protein
MEKTASMPSPRPRPTRRKPCPRKPRDKAPRTKAAPAQALDPAAVARMIDQVKSIILILKEGGADGNVAAAGGAGGSATSAASERKEKWTRDLDREMEKLLIIKSLLEASLPAASENKELPAEQPRPVGPRKVLVIDDDPTTLKLISHFLEKENYRVSTSLSGVEGLKKALREAPDIILLDIMMPDLNGFQLLSIYRQAEENARTPVLILSSLAEEADILKGLGIGAVDYITKPFSPQLLMAKIKKNLSSGP